MKKLITLFIILLTLNVVGQEVARVEPPNWWAGMKNPDLQLLIYGENISKTDVVLDYPGVTLEATTKVENPNYMFVDLKLAKDEKPGDFEIQLKQGDNVVDS